MQELVLSEKAGEILKVCLRKIDVDELVPHTERMDWDSLRDDLKKNGIRK